MNIDKSISDLADMIMTWLNCALAVGLIVGAIAGYSFRLCQESDSHKDKP
jgi:hypothetical protein